MSTRILLRLSRSRSTSNTAHIRLSRSNSTKPDVGVMTSPVTLPVAGHKLTYSEFGDPIKVIRKEPLHIEYVQDNHSLVKMLAAPVNPADINTIQGTYPAKPAPSLPSVPGNEGVGVVVRASSQTSNLSEGDWVIPVTPGKGTWQAYLTGTDADFIKIPNNLDLITAATLSVNPCTAYRMLTDFETLKEGDCVIQNGGNSAVGQAVIQLCRERGLKCVSLVRPREDFKQLKASLLALGNQDTTILTDEDLRSMSRDFTAQLALNCVGGKSATEILRMLEEGRTMVTYGGMSRQPIIIPTSSLIFKDVRLTGFWMTRWNATHSLEERQRMLDDLCTLALKGNWTPPAHKTLPLAKYRDALDSALKGYTNAKTIFKFDDKT